MTGPRLYHGGVPGLAVGDVLAGGHRRKVHAGCPTCEAHERGEDGQMEPVTGHRDQVYVSTDREYARFYASQYGRGDVYRVEPVDGFDVVRSDEDSFETYRAERFVVAGIVARAVLLTWPQRRRLFRQWGVADAARFASSRPGT